VAGQPDWEDSFRNEQDAQQELRGAAGDLVEDVAVADFPSYPARRDQDEDASDVRAGAVLFLWTEADVVDVHHRFQEGHEELGKIRAYFVEDLCLMFPEGDDSCFAAEEVDQAGEGGGSYDHACQIHETLHMRVVYNGMKVKVFG